MLYQGSLIAVGTKEELQSSSHPRIRQFFDRVPDRVNGHGGPGTIFFRAM